MSIRPSEDPIQFLTRLLGHAEKHLELAKKALESKEFETLDFTLSVVISDCTTMRQYMNTLAERGIINKLKV